MFRCHIVFKGMLFMVFQLYLIRWGRHKYLPFFFMVSFVTHVSASRLNESTISNRMTPNMAACIAVESISILEKLHSKG
jgi:hypothetical protein